MPSYSRHLLIAHAVTQVEANGNLRDDSDAEAVQKAEQTLVLATFTL
jgi:hypothetical protein